MYKCPKRRNTESLYADGEFTFLGWAQFDGNGQIIGMCDVEKRKISYFEIDEMRCDECGYEAPSDEFKE